MIGQLLAMLGTWGMGSRCMGAMYEPKIPKELLELEELKW